MKFLNNLDLNGNEIQNFKVHMLATDPASLSEALMWYNTTTKKLKYYDGTATQTLLINADLVGLLEYKGVINASTNPNYPAGSVGDVYVFSVGGKIGGASGESVSAGDMIICNANNAGGTEASVGASWDTVNKNIADNIATKYSQTGVTVGTAAGVVTITHNLNSRAVVVEVHNSTTYERVFLDVVHATVNTITLSANGASTTVDVTVIG